MNTGSKIQNSGISPSPMRREVEEFKQR